MRCDERQLGPFPFLITLAAVALASPSLVSAFDTAWHFRAAAEPMEELGFTPYAKDVTCLGLWGADFFSVPYQVLLGERLEEMRRGPGFALVAGLGSVFVNATVDDEKRTTVREESIFLHFDNIAGDLQRNRDTAYLWQRLFASTSAILREAHGDPDLDADSRSLVILLALGSSLHMVQDFYSHSNWIHQDFAAWGLEAPSSSRVPTYFETLEATARATGGPGEVPFEIEIGIYPGSEETVLTRDGVPKDHLHMHHDHTQLDRGTRPTLNHHRAGPVSALRSPEQHQQIAVSTAAAATREWLWKLRDDAVVRRAIDRASSAVEPPSIFGGSARTSLEAIVRVSLMIGTWDGPRPSPREASVKRATEITASSALLKLMRGEREFLPNPLNRFWSLFVDQSIARRLTRGFGAPRRGRYDLGSRRSGGEEATAAAAP